MKGRVSITCSLLFLPGAVCLAAQQPLPTQAEIEARIKAQTTNQQSTGPVLKPNPLDLLHSFEPGANEEYTLGAGDEITVDFAGRPEMQSKLVMGPDGGITLPLAGEIKLAGLTRSQAAQAIVAALNPYYQNLEAQVTVTKYTSNQVLVLGAVDHPGVLNFDGTPTLLEALARAGVENGPSKTDQPGANQIPERCAIYRGNDKIVWVQLKELIDTGNTMADLRLRRGDVVYVPSMADRFVSVLGEVQHPGAIPLTYNSTLASVLASAGGLTEKAGNHAHIQIVDPSTGVSRVIAFKDILNPAKSLEVTLKPGEVIFVPRSGFNRAAYVLQSLNPLVEVMSIAYFAGAL